MGHRKFKREYQAKHDHSQSKFTQSGALKLTQPMTSELLAKYDMTDKFMCAFCLGIHPLQKYLISTGKGVHQGLAKCPECGNQMRMSTLVSEWTPEQYAEFAYPYAASGFWQKVPFATWSKRLYKIGWSHRFWKRYKELKGTDEQETPEEHMYRQQREQAEEQGLVDEHG